MSVEVKCKTNEEISFGSPTEANAVFKLSTPYNINNIQDYSYGIREWVTSTSAYKTSAQYDENGNIIFTDFQYDDNGEKIPEQYTDGRNAVTLSAKGYYYYFPHNPNNDFVGNSGFNNTIGWFNSFGTDETAKVYSFGNAWTFTLDKIIAGATKEQFVNKNVKLGLYDEYNMLYDSGTGAFCVPNNNAIFDYFITNYDKEKQDNKSHNYFRVKVNNEGDYFVRYEISTPDTSFYNTYYNETFDNVLFTLNQVENVLKFDSSKFPEDIKIKLYGNYYYNGADKNFEVETGIQDKLNEYVRTHNIKSNFFTFKNLIEIALKDVSDAIKNNIRYCNIVFEKGKNDNVKKYIVGDFVYLNILDDFSGLDKNLLKEGNLFTLKTTYAAIKPEFLMNGNYLIDIPAYFYDIDKLENVSTENFSYDPSNNQITFEVKCEGLVPDDLSLECDDENVKASIVRSSTEFNYYPECYDVCKYYYSVIRPSADVYEEPPFTLTQSNGLLLNSADNYRSNEEDNIHYFGPSGGKFTLGSHYPLSQYGQVKFPYIKKFRVVLKDTKTVNTFFKLTSRSLREPQYISVRYSGVAGQGSFEKLDNTIARTIQGVTLQPYMYDATNIKFSYLLENGYELNMDNNNFTLTINEHTLDPKTFEDIKLLDEIINRKDFDEWIFSDGITKNVEEHCYEMNIFIAAKGREGKGFNDSSVSVSYTPNEFENKFYNLKDFLFVVNYYTALPPYLIQGRIYTEEPSKEQVLDKNSETARVDYSAGCYMDNIPLPSNTIPPNLMFTNADPLYCCDASGFMPIEANADFLNVDSYVHDEETNQFVPIAISASGMSPNVETLILTSAEQSYSNDGDVSSYGDFNVYTFKQAIDSDAVRARGYLAQNELYISAHIDYTVVTEHGERQDMIIIGGDSEHNGRRCFAKS